MEEEDQEWDLLGLKNILRIICRMENTLLEEFRGFIEFLFYLFYSSLFGSASILTISHAYIALLGFENVKKSTAVAVLNANYLMKKLQNHYKIAFLGNNQLVAHEFILGILTIFSNNLKRFETS